MGNTYLPLPLRLSIVLSGGAQFESQSSSTSVNPVKPFSPFFHSRAIKQAVDLPNPKCIEQASSKASAVLQGGLVNTVPLFSLAPHAPHLCAVTARSTSLSIHISCSHRPNLYATVRYVPIPNPPPSATVLVCQAPAIWSLSPALFGLLRIYRSSWCLVPHHDTLYKL